ncbi:hypothetical protein DL1_13835 [Thioclava dalianensis]|uniref:Uncharacterized protein n=1 Tax=Thioclava dalianensis TaxID=1185766 RepID=A0A074U8G6_9RHOB|nr:hypothetical protein [Thioclava dalianensis]KEP70967.1 hypothetical protein DL1_13835 [Thioclava dalianensis]SFN13148.1 hypothetical protein SAMN05216224_102558 [Thioclava dalianensis]
MAAKASTRAGAGIGLRVYVLGALGLSGLAVLFWMTWKSQFAAPAGYLFETPTQPVEAGYCLAVARQVVPGASYGGYITEAKEFWLQRLLDFSGPLASNIMRGEIALNRHLQAFEGPDRAWLMNAMDSCSHRALTYGARFKSFE